ncbi:hypothetical protein C2845_PM17G14020 [Panicum miliaceum]|uniref:Uncharacterized protein n=1 Tax=Panicum miliaceum TaxID=4540 RepID=A0A3L6Q446_PANMI|nr:hypothetical protein C2845_PM17G14020 [Panicum miliaceum]
MDSGDSAAPAAGDRLSGLDDAALGHILSFLPATEAARAAVLSRRWRHVFPAVHTLSFREAERPFSVGYPWFRLCSYCERATDDVRAPLFATGLGAALIGRDRGARAAAAPLRALRIAFDEYGFLGGDARGAVDAWLTYAAYHAGDALQVDLRLDGGLVCGREYALLAPGLDAEGDGGGDDDDQALDGNDDHGGEGEDQIMPMNGDYLEASSPAAAAGEPCPEATAYVTPRILFSCATLRSLRLGGCWLDLPSAIALPSLDALHLTRITGRRGAVQRLVTACPRLADLTLEACNDLTELSVRHTHLRRLALRCCHDLAAVAADSSELRAFEYRGAVPGRGFLSMPRPTKISLCTLDFCGEEPAGPPELGFLQPFVGVERMHLTSARLGRGVVGHGAGAFSRGLEFPALRNLELTGMLPEDDDAAVAAVTGILERAPRLETLSLFFLPEPHLVVTKPYFNKDYADEEQLHATHKLRYGRHAAALAVPDVEIPCLRERTREINLVHYQGAMAQRMLAKFLLRNAPVVDEVCCEFARGPLSIQTKLMEEIKGWVMNKSANMMFF